MFIGDKNRLWIYKCIDLPRRFLLFWDPMKNSYGGQVNQPADGLPVSVFRLYFVVFPAPFSQFANIVSLEFVLLWQCRRFWREKRIEPSINQSVNTRYAYWAKS